MVAACILWLLLASPVPTSLDGWGTGLLLGLLAIWVVLGAGSGWVVFRRNQRLDEFASELRDRSYRVGFRLVVLGFLLLVPALVVGAYGGGTTVSWGVPDPVGARGVAAVVVLLVLLPTAAAAWLMPPQASRNEGRPGSKRFYPALPTALAALLVVGVSCAWVIGVQVASVGTATLVTVPDPQLEWSGGQCGGYAAVAELDRGFGPGLGMAAHVCWNGRRAYLANYPQGPSPAGLFFATSGVVPPLCSPATDATDFGTLTRRRCSVWVDGQGSVHILVRALASTGLPFLGNRHLLIYLEVTRDGRVVHLT